jgi:hypothetical protein
MKPAMSICHPQHERDTNSAVIELLGDNHGA